MINVVAHQMFIMAIFLMAGSILFKTKLISQEGSKTLTTLLIYLITPVAIFRSFCTERTPERVKAFLISLLLCAFVQGLGLLLSHFMFRKRPLEEYAVTYPNAGFFGIPVIQACLGTEAVFYIAPLVVFVGTLQHSYGSVLLLGSKKELNWKKVLLAPNFVGFIAGLIVFFGGIGTKLPDAVNQCVNLVANMNAFFAMAILGIFLVQSDLTQLYKNIEIYTISFLRLLIIPLLCSLIFKFIPVNYTMRMAILLAFAGPVGSNVANYSLLYNKDYSKASLYVAISTVFCLGTLPLYAFLTERIL